MKTILVIEDDEQIRDYLLKILELNEYHVLATENGAAGLQLARIHLPDLVLCDVMMPYVDGYEVLSALRQNAETMMIPVIFLSAQAERSAVRQGMNLGADDYLTKPFTSAELLETIAARLDKQSALTQPYVEEMKRAAARLSYAAYCDPLTNLPNRIVLRQQLQDAIDRQPHSPAPALLYLKLDLDQVVATADAVLQATALRLSECIADRFLLARIGTDEFGLVIDGLDRSAIEELAQHLLDALAAPWQTDAMPIALTVRIGIAIATDSSADRLLGLAETASRWVQAGRYAVFTPAMQAAEVEQQQLEAELRQALMRSEFQLYYQPQINVITGRMIGVEALLRWQHPQRGLLLPSDFVPAAEAAGLMVAIGDWVLQAACVQMQSWQRLSLVALRLTVNLTAGQFQHPNLSTSVRQVLAQTGFDPNLLVLELTEASIMNESAATIATLTALRQQGIEISIDDFGNGYSSLNYLRRFPISALKIARSFVGQMLENPHDAAIVSAIIAIARSLKLKVAASGVETKAQLAFLKRQGCQAFQGNFYSPAQLPDAIERLLSEDKRS